MRLRLLLLAPLILAGMETIAQAANPEHVQRLLKTNQCPQCDLSGASLKDANLYGANLVNANLTGADLTGANLGSANLSDANLTGAKLTQTYLYSATLENTNLTQADLSGAYLKDARLTGVELTGAILQGANLSRTNLSGVSLKGSNLSDANLSYTILSGFTTQDKKLSNFSMDSIMVQTQFLCRYPLNDYMIESVKQSGFDLAFADLGGATLKNANLTGAMLLKANLSNADLTGANLTNACLRSSDLKEARLDGADLKDATMEDAVLTGASFKDVKNAQLPPPTPTAETNQVYRAYQAEAKQYVGSMNRAQQAYYLERGRFSRTIPELGLGIRTETENYLYRVFTYADRKRATMTAGVPRKAGLKSYIGFVNVARNSNNEEITIATVCESVEPKPLLPKLPATVPARAGVACPSGFVPLNR